MAYFVPKTTNKLEVLEGWLGERMKLKEYWDIIKIPLGVLIAIQLLLLLLPYALVSLKLFGLMPVVSFVAMILTLGLLAYVAWATVKKHGGKAIDAGIVLFALAFALSIVSGIRWVALKLSTPQLVGVEPQIDGAIRYTFTAPESIGNPIGTALSIIIPALKIAIEYFIIGFVIGFITERVWPAKTTRKKRK